MWNYKCLHCGARLDPGEKCDCQDERQRYLRQFRMSRNGQYQFIFGGKSTRLDVTSYSITAS